MADPISDSRAMVALSRLLTERNAAFLELDAARKRIAELEQQPPMQLVDFGVGFNWAGLREDMQRLRDERDAARAQLQADDQRAWEALGKPEGTYDTTNVQRLCAEVARLRGIIDDIEVESGHCHFLDDAEHEPPHLPDHVRAIVQERDAARAELRRMSEWHDEIADNLRAEVERLRADLREAMELLRAHGQPPDWLRQHPARCDSWERRYGALLAKHKETP